MGVKVCQLCAVDFTLQKFLLPLIDGMRAAGWQVVAVCSDGPAVKELRDAGYRIETVPIARNLNPLRHAISIVRLLRLLRRERFDVLHAHTPIAALLGRIAARLAGIPLVIYTAHGFYFHDQMPVLKRRLYVVLERVGGRLTDYLFTQSAEDAQAAVNESIVDRGRVLTIGNGVDVARFDANRLGRQQPLRHELGCGDRDFLIGMVSRLVAEKGVAEFLAAARRVAQDHPQARFVLVGERLPSDHALGVAASLTEAQAALGDRLVLTGLRNDVPELLAAMDLFCLPSWREGMPRTIIEAMLMGKPVIATDIRGAREEVVPEVTGLLVPTRSPDGLAQAMLRFVADPEWGSRLGAAGRERARRLYDERNVVALQISTIARLAADRGLH